MFTMKAMKILNWINIHSKPMGTLNAFTIANYHCKPLMTNVIFIHKIKIKL